MTDTSRSHDKTSNPSSNTSTPANWVDLKELVEVRFGELVKHYDYRLNSLDDIRRTQAAELERRLTQLDEAQRTKYPTREDIRLITENVSNEIRQIREAQASQIGRASVTSFYVTLVIALAGLSVALFEMLSH